VTVLVIASIAGMIVFSIKDNVGGAIAAGTIGAIAILCLMTGNAIHVGTNGGGAQQALEAELDARVGELVASGVDEEKARAVVAKAIRFGRGIREGSKT
jgi:hypothetical protein